MRLNWAQGVAKFFITDDNFARNKDWEAIFDRLIDLRENQGIPLGLMIQVDTLCHKIPNFIEKSKRAGVTRVFIGLENVNPDNLAGAKKRQNKVSEYRKMLLAWKAQGILTIAGYILGFPADTVETIRRDIAIIKKELPLDIIEFFCLTPLPGSEDHQIVWKNKGPLHADLNTYDAAHVCTDHPRMTRQDWVAIYQEAWSLYYTRDHMTTLLRRGAVCGLPLGSLVKLLVIFATTVRLEKVHPLETGILRLRRHPSERRPGLQPRQSPWMFWPRFVFETLRKYTVHGWNDRRPGARLAMKIARDPNAKNYKDQALTPVADDDNVTLDLLTKTGGVLAQLNHQKKVAELTHAAPPRPQSKSPVAQGAPAAQRAVAPGLLSP